MVPRETVQQVIAAHGASEIAALRQRALRAERRADGFVHMVHEIRTLLSGVTGLSEILLDGELADEQRQHVRRIRSSGAAVLEVVNGVLDFAKLEAGTLAVETADFNLRDAIADVISLAADRAAAKGIVLGATVDGDVPSAVAGDRVRLRQALLNLVVNAVKFTDEGSVRVHVRLPKDVVRPKGKVLVAIDVVDTGVGISSEALATLFQPFRQAGARRAEGTGLGLSIVRGFTEVMGGAVTCESQPGRGSCFTLTLPLDVRGVAPTRKQSVLRPLTVEKNGLSVLVVEDDLLNARITRHFLERRGWSVDVARDGREAVERVQHALYHLVLLDWHTPRLDGLSAAREIRRGEASGHHIPLVALTAVATEGARAQCIDAGMDDFLTKPIVQSALDEVLAKVADGSYSQGREPTGTIAAPNEIDFDVLTSLGEGAEGSERVVAELGRIFETCATARAAELRDAVSRRDVRAAYLAVHSLRGMCAQMGANALAARYMDLEACAKRGDISTMEGALARADEDLQAVLGSFGTWLARTEAR